MASVMRTEHMLMIKVTWIELAWSKVGGLSEVQWLETRCMRSSTGCRLSEIGIGTGSNRDKCWSQKFEALMCFGILIFFMALCKLNDEGEEEEDLASETSGCLKNPMRKPSFFNHSDLQKGHQINDGIFFSVQYKWHIAIDESWSSSQWWDVKWCHPVSEWVNCHYEV